MSMQLEVTVYGPQLGEMLAGDPEELAYALKEMAGYDGDKLGREVAEFMPSGHADIVAAFLRHLAAAIDPKREV